MPVRRHAPVVVVPRSTKYAAHHDYGIDDSISRAGYLSNAVLEDTYEAANRSRGKDNELMRSVHAAIRSPSRSRDHTPTRTGRHAKRFHSLPPIDISPAAKSPKAVVPYRNLEKIKSALSSPPPASSLLSTKISSYLRGSSLPPAPLSRNTASNISYKSFLHRDTPGRDDTRSHVSYKSFLSDPAVSSPFSTRSSTKLIHGYVPPAYVATSYRSSSPYVSRANTSYPDTAEYDYNYDDDEDYEPGSYRRKYKIVRSPSGSSVLRYGTSRPALTQGSAEFNDDDDAFYDTTDRYGTYSCPRPSGVSPLRLSSYDGEYDGSYEADMAEMYDYVPFGPTRQGILELTQDDEDIDRPSSYLTPPSLTSANRFSSSSSPSPSLPSVSVVPAHPRHLGDQPSLASHHLIDSIVSSTAARAKAVLDDARLPPYKHASLLLSVEGSAVSEDGQNRYGFRYYPPPIPLRGSQIGLDERIVGISPKPVSPADSFLSKYLDRVRNIRTEVRDHLDRGDYARGRSVVPVSTPHYSHSTIHMPVHISGRAHSVPVSSYRSRLDDGQSHRVDVFPLVVSETTVPTDRKIHLPLYGAGTERSGAPSRLTVLEKINIKAAIIGSKMEAADSPRRQKKPKSQFAANKLRQMRLDDMERKYK